MLSLIYTYIKLLAANEPLYDAFALSLGISSYNELPDVDFLFKFKPETKFLGGLKVAVLLRLLFEKTT